MRERARAVVIGGGVGGCSILYWLTRLGWEDVVLVERAELTSGSTFHSAGLVGQLRSSLSLTRMMMESVDLYRSLEAEVGLETGWHEVGSLRLVERAAALGFTPMTGSELEFYLLRETYEEAWAHRYEDLTPSVPYILDYHILATTYDEALIRQIRNGMHGAGIKVETSKGEAWPGQHEINFRFADALTMADNHAIYKNGAKEIANLNGCSITFMAKPFESWIGNSCHIHASLFRDGEPAFRDDPALFDCFLAGMIACFKELAIFLAPTINSYKRYAAGSWAPTTLAWGNDNRTCGFRLVGHGASRRVETRIPGGDVNPYLAFAAMIAAGLHGIENELELPPGLEGNAYESDAERFPASLREAILALELGTTARGAFGDQVVDHYLNYAHTEQALFDKVVTDWERMRLFERG